MIKSYFRKESINLNFVLVLVFFENITEALIGALPGKDAAATLTPKRKRNEKVHSELGIRFFENSKLSTHLLFSIKLKLS